jgi:hypothetical protein
MEGENGVCTELCTCCLRNCCIGWDGGTHSSCLKQHATHSSCTTTLARRPVVPQTYLGHPSTLLHIISVRPYKQPLMVCNFLKVYMELGSYFLFLQEQIKDIIIITPPLLRCSRQGDKHNGAAAHCVSPFQRTCLKHE